MPKPSSPRPINGRESALTSSLRSYASKKSKKNGKGYFSGSEGYDLQGASFDSGRSLDSPKFMSKTIDFQPRNKNQKILMDKIMDKDHPPIIVVTGSPGTGKTVVPVIAALRKLHSGEIKKIVITRPAVSVDEKLGHLPGTLEQKMEPFLAAIYQAMELWHTTREIDMMIENKIIDIIPLGFCRGLTFSDCVCILDEAASTSKTQMLSFLTRVGPNCTLVISGDLEQSDLSHKNNGLKDLMSRIGEGVKGEIEVLKFTEDDIVRHPVIKTILRLYKDDDGPKTYMDRA